MKISKYWSPGLALFIALLAYQFFYAFKYFSITEGWFSVYAWLIREGNMPYSDFSLLMPPLYPLEIALIQSVFGDQLWILRVCGLAIVSGIGLSLWAILSRFFNPWIAAFSAGIGTIYYQSGNAFIGYDFTQVLTLNLLLFALFILKELDFLKIEKSKSYFFTPAFFAGLFLISAVLTKQSNASLFGLVVFVGFVFVSFILAPTRSALYATGQFCLGTLVLLVPVLIWLILHNSQQQFIQQILFDAMQSKGGGGKIFLGWVNGFFMDGSYIARFIVVGRELISLFTWTCLPTVGIYIFRAYLNQIQEFEPNVFFHSNLIASLSRRSRIFVALSAIVLIVITAYGLGPIKSPSSQNAHEFTLSFIFHTMIVVAWIGLGPLVYWVIHTLVKKKNLNQPLIHWLRKSQILISLIGFLLLFGLLMYVAINPNISIPIWRGYGDHIGSGIIFFSTNLYIFGASISILIFSTKPSFLKAKFLILFLAGVGLIMGNGTSAGLSEISAFYGLSILLAALLTLSAPLLFPSVVPLVASILLTFSVLERKLEMPYSWWSIRSEDIRSLVCVNTVGVLDHICVDQKKYTALSKLLSAMQDASSSNSELYVFPHMPIFNLMSGLLPYKNLVVSWFDFTSQERAKNITADLLQDPPQLTLIARLPIEVFEGHERLFNHSLQSEQRNIVAAIDELARVGRIKLIETAYVDGLQLDLYQKIGK